MRQLFCGRHIGRDRMIPLYLVYYIVCPNPEIKKEQHTQHTIYLPLPFLQARELKSTYIFVAYLFSITWVFFLFLFFSRTLCTVPVSLIIVPPCSSGNKVVFEPAQSDTVFIRRHMSHLYQYQGKGTRQSKQASSPPVWKSFDKFTLWK